MFIVFGAWLAGLFFMVKDGLPWLGAQLSGSIRTRSQKREKIDRATDPVRFRTLSRQRLQGTGLGLLAFAIGWAWLIGPTVLVLISAFMRGAATGVAG